MLEYCGAVTWTALAPGRAAGYVPTEAEVLSIIKQVRHPAIRSR
jgi:hypothetical protein